MSTTGAIHTAAGLAAVVLGAVILLRPKATRTHVWLGRAYVFCMLLMNGTSFVLQSVFGPFGPFHYLSVISLATLALGVVPVLLRRPRRSWLAWHYYGILFSYVGLLAATVSEVTVRIIGGIDSWPAFWVRVVGSSVLVSVVGTFLILFLRGRTFRRLGKRGGRTIPPVPAAATSAALIEVGRRSTP